MDLRRFWRALDAVYAQEAVEAEWLRALEGDKETWRWGLDTGLIRATGELSQAYPKLEAVPQSPLDYDVICHDDDEEDYVGVCPDGTGKIKLSRKELMVYGVDVVKLSAILAAALGLMADHRELPGLASTWCVGGYQPFQSAEAWVYLAMPHGSKDLSNTAMHMVAMHEPPFLILTPTQRWWRAWPAQLTERGRMVALSELMAVADSPSQPLTCAASVATLLEPLLGKETDPSDIAIFRRQGAGWLFTFEGTTVAMPDKAGYGYIRLLLARAGVPIHAADLTALDSGSQELSQRADDRGQPSLDARGWREAKETANRLQQRLAEAREANDLALEQSVRDEMRQLADAQSAAKGHRGSDRRIGNAADTTRKSVCNAIERALTEIQSHHQQLWNHLDATIKRGEVLLYNPSRPPPWQL